MISYSTVVAFDEAIDADDDAEDRLGMELLIVKEMFFSIVNPDSYKDNIIMIKMMMMMMMHDDDKDDDGNDDGDDDDDYEKLE